MDLSTIHHGIQKRKGKKRVGRGIGSGHGKTASRGAKGQYASAGAKKPSWTFEGGQMPFFRRMPKRGFSHATWDKDNYVINVGDMNDVFDDGASVDLQALKDAGVCNGKYDGLRVLGTGELTKKLVIRANHFSKSAAEKIAAKGGTADLIPAPKKPVKNKMKKREPKA